MKDSEEKFFKHSDELIENLTHAHENLIDILGIGVISDEEISEEFWKTYRTITHCVTYAMTLARVMDKVVMKKVIENN